MTLTGYYEAADGIAQDFERKLNASIATTNDLKVTDDALKVLEKEAEEISLTATSTQERLDAERLWARIRNYRENLGFPSRDSLFATLDNSPIH